MKRKEHTPFYFSAEVDQALRECDEARARKLQADYEASKVIPIVEYDKEERKMNASELKANVEQGGDRFFFTRDTMKFFGDRMSNYGVRNGGSIPYHWDDTGNNYSETPHMIEVWELYRKRPVKHGLSDSAYFDKKTYRRVFKES